jgi:hypothetical protein
MPQLPGASEILQDRMPILTAINPIWLWLFKHGYESPDWGKRAIDQHNIAITIHELAGAITDSQVKNELRNITAKLILATSEQMVRDSQ